MKKKQLRWLLPLAALPVLWLLYWGMGRDTYVLPSPMAGLQAPATTFFRLSLTALLLRVEG